ncbi:hypothetical protein LshimejAT787_1001020 [Lyophyllum shimeji]|uniref:Uncharacterized protein n=1 Tax=Lyophyllum shimeji TaxID=47721 RepID=A0A9P3UQQ8_LYOSH|nr:hypothetical protein LshimejAT787_1001020 [Lyophyllum shimeji]
MIGLSAASQACGGADVINKCRVTLACVSLLQGRHVAKWRTTGLWAIEIMFADRRITLLGAAAEANTSIQENLLGAVVYMS